MIFGVNDAKKFFGYAKLKAEPDKKFCPNLFKNEKSEASKNLGDNFKIKWLKYCELDYEKTMNLRNPINDYMIRDNKDFTEIEENAARRLCMLLD